VPRSSNIIGVRSPACASHVLAGQHAGGEQAVGQGDIWLRNSTSARSLSTLRGQGWLFWIVAGPGTQLFRAAQIRTLPARLVPPAIVPDLAGLDHYRHAFDLFRSTDRPFPSPDRTGRADIGTFRCSQWIWYWSVIDRARDTGVDGLGDHFAREVGAAAGSVAALGWPLWSR
jgi:hypothetical protein